MSHKWTDSVKNFLHLWRPESLYRESKPISVFGLNRGAQAFGILSQAMAQKSHVHLVVVPQEGDQHELLGNLQSLLEFLPQSQKPRLMAYPTWHPTGFSSVHPSIRVRLERIRALIALQEDSPLILVGTLAAYQQRTIPKEVLQQLETHLSVEQANSSLLHTTRRLSDAGYQRVEIVQDPGTWSLRGDLLDVYPLNTPNPYRIEFFGDDIERIRPFEAESQRTYSNGVDHLRIGVAREAIINKNTCPRLRSRIKKMADHQAISRRIRDPIMEAVHPDTYLPHSDLWAPWIYSDQKATLFDHVDEYSIVWVDPVACLETHQSYLENQTKWFDQNQGRPNLFPPVDELYLSETDINQKSTWLTRFEKVEIAASTTNGFSSRVHLEPIPSPRATGSNPAFIEVLETWAKDELNIHIFCQSSSGRDRIEYLLQHHPDLLKRIRFFEGGISDGFCIPQIKCVCINDFDLFGKTRGARPSGRTVQKPASKQWKDLKGTVDFEPGDYIVHIEHGIGKFEGLKHIDQDGVENDFLILDYASGDRLYLPVYRLDQIQKYVGAGTGRVGLSRLGTSKFKAAKDKVRNAVKKLAFDLTELYAKRRLQKGDPFQVRDDLYYQFESAFPFVETPDQIEAINDTLRDLESGQVMDRLICGDVGFGKTEVAMRAAYSAVLSGKQVAVLVPTTVLVLQHEQTFKNRFKDYPVEIQSVSRLKSRQKQIEVLEQVEEGRVDILIGTHRLLSKDVKFSKLGLLIIDEEHRFGVEHKEKIKNFKVNTHVLTLTATPIPRTLHMALAGIRSISIIATPPVDRLPITTYISPHDPNLIRAGIENELSRGGQVYFLHNRVETIERVAQQILELVPQSKVVIGHGQMGERQLEKVMLQFYKKEANVLVCTTIIESGLDVPSANTMMVDRADTFGLAQLYQIRGRVGRSNQRAYAYFLVSESGRMTSEARQRLEVLQKFVDLGSGFQIASQDLEIRGGGNLLGPEQSGHIGSVGFELYTQLLEHAVAEIQGDESHLSPEQAIDPEIKTAFSAYLGSDYIQDDQQRLSFYRRLSMSKDDAGLQELELELKDRYGPLPQECTNLIWVIRLKKLLIKNGVQFLGYQKGRAHLHFASTQNPVLGKIVDKIGLGDKNASDQKSMVWSKFKITPDGKVGLSGNIDSIHHLYFELERFLT